ncbi:MAG TPA: cell surface protein SprA, partial [Saprospiraceae bacterium]|nr:cell surface protein SprA [Saprospiraceae bacterium]
KYVGFNGMEGNSKETSGKYIESSTNYPNTEDLNRDNSLNETEAYFQYDIPINYGGSGLLRESGSENSFVTESIVTDKGDRWYHFKIPLSQYDHAVGGIQDFRSIRFMRIITHGFQDEVIFRFATLELVRNQWRRYSRDEAACPNVKFEVNEVNIEENSKKLPFNYVLPPGVTREDIIGTVTAGAQQNENSLMMKIDNLCPGQERGIFKTLNMDMRVYKRLQLFVHAEALDNVPNNQKVFIRMGKDFTNNYYEYEIPLTFSNSNIVLPEGSEEYRENVWPAANFFDFPLELLKKVKLQRNHGGGGASDSLTITDPAKPDNLVTVVGNPNIGRVKTVMIGVKNEDGTTSSMEVWVNELRLSGLEEGGGLAGLARVDLKMADFGSLALSGNYSSIGYGAIDQKLGQRSREQVVQYDLAGNFELGKFLPEKSGVKIPFFAQYSKQIKSPQYDPYDLDVELKDNLANAPNKAEIKEKAQDVTTIKSFNFTNVRKDKTNGKKPKPWDISNLSATYAYSETDRHNPLIAQDNLKRYRGGLDYQYATKTKYIKPFKKLIKKDKYLKFISEFNFNLIPNSFGVSTTMDRSFNKTVYRFAGEDPLLNTYFNKNFVWDRDYTLNWNFTKSLKFAFNAQSNSVIDEPTEFDAQGNLRPEGYVKDSIWTNIKSLGRIKQYRHNMTLNYDLPFKHLPLMDWVRAKATFSADYTWNAAALNVQELGNVAQNSQVRKINGDLNFTKLYGKSKYLKKIDKSLGGRSARSSRRNSRTNRKSALESGGAKDKAGSRGRRSRGDKKNDAEANKDDKSNSADKSKTGASKATGKNDKKTKKKSLSKKERKKAKKKKKKEREPSALEKGLVRPLLAIRKGRVVYAERYASVVPGFIPKAKYLGQDEGFSSPGWDFVTGFQPNDNKLNSFASNNWITDNIMLNQPLSRTYAQEFNASVTVEPFRDFKIDVDASKDFTRNRTEMFKDTLNDGFRDIVHALPRTVGSYTVSFYNANTIFQKDIVGLFHQFEENRKVISRRLLIQNYKDQGLPVPAELPAHQVDTGFVEGYGRFQQDVLVPAFLSAYTKTDPNVEKLNFFKTLPRPNWKLTYTGLSKIPMFKELFRSFSLRHGYSSKMTVNAYNTATNYDPNNRNKLNENTYSYYSQFEIPDISIREQFNPLIGLDMRMKNDMSLNFSYNKARNLDLSFVDYKLAETKTTDVTFGFGYTIKNVEIGFLSKKKKRGRKKKVKKKEPKNGKNGKKPSNSRGAKKPKAKNLVIKMNFSLRDDVTFNHQLDQNVTIPIRGTNTFSMSPTIDYNINKRLTLQFYFDHRRTTPKTSSSPPTVSTSSGITLRFNLGK